jgi:hypothetical protein
MMSADIYQSCLGIFIANKARVPTDPAKVAAAEERLYAALPACWSILMT